MGSAFTLTVDSRGHARLVFDLPSEKINKLTADVLAELDHLIDTIQEDKKIQVIVLSSAKKDIFIAGADINEIAEIMEPNDGTQKALRGQAILNKLENLNVPTIAIIDGACLGGGLELALACTYRISTDHPKTKLGLPEVKLGIIPGFGGTQRLPRLIGLQRGLPMILSGRPIDGLQAYRYKLTDACFPREFLDEKINGFVKSILSTNGRRHTVSRRRNGLLRQLVGERNPIVRSVMFNAAKKNLKKKTRNLYPAPLTALEVLKKTRSMSLSTGLKVEAEHLGKLAAGNVCKNLVRLFFINEDIKKDKGVYEDVSPIKILRAGVLGAGIMGGGIAWLLSKADVPVRLKDLDWEAIGRGYRTASTIYGKLKQLRKYNDREINLKMHLITGTTDYSGFKQSDLVIEAVVEDLEVKKNVLSELEEHVRSDTIIATNTSTIPISVMEKFLAYPERFLGMHFFNPVNRMSLVEVIPGEQTSPQTIATVMAFARRLGKTPIKVRSCPGFLVNRLLLPYLNEAFYMVQEGIDPRKIDSVLYDFGMPMGPLTLVEKIGFNVGYKAAEILEKSYGPRMKIAEILSAIYGNKSLLGKNQIYLSSGKNKELNPEVSQIIQVCQSQNALSSRPLSDYDIVERAILVIINEASRCLQEKIVDKPSYLDMAVIMGIGFPAFRGGVLRYADAVGIDIVVDKMESQAKTHGERFKPSELLLEMKKKKVSFYDNETIR